MKELVAAFNQEKALVGVLSLIVKTDGSFAALKVYESYLQMVAAQVEAPEGGEVPDLDGQVGDLVTAHIQLHQAGHVPHLLGEAHLVIMI